MNICTDCKEECHIVEIDEGLGEIEAHGIVKNHVCIVERSNCCEAPIREVPPGTFLHFAINIQNKIDKKHGFPQQKIPYVYDKVDFEVDLIRDK